jgi:hypothetical protein
MRTQALIGPGCPFFIHRLDCRGVEGYGGLIHGDNIVRDCQQLPTKGAEGSPWCAALSTLFGHWTAVRVSADKHLYKAKINSESGLHCGKSHVHR